MSKKYTLLIKPTTFNTDNTLYYHNYSQFHEGDAGVDLYTLENINVPPKEQVKIKFGIACECICKTLFPFGEYKQNVGYFLAPRSSISKTPLRMSNSIGIIDAGYRGEIMAVCDNISEEEYIIEKGTRLFQLLNTDLVPFNEVNLVEELSETSRGDGGFGSTNENTTN